MNKLSYFITFIVVLTFTSCDAWREKQKKESIRRATEECAQKTHINGFAIYFHDYTKDTLLPIEIKIKHYRNGNTETIRDTVPTQKNYQTYRDYYLEHSIALEDTVWVSTPEQKTKKIHSFEYQVFACYTMFSAQYCCGFSAMTTEGENDRDTSVHFSYNK